MSSRPGAPEGATDTAGPCSSARPSTIPKTLHRIWIGGPLPTVYDVWGQEWARLHPDWELRLWGETDLDALPMRNRALYDLAETEAPTDALRWRVDVARLEILYLYGGVYVDCDTQPLKAFDPLLTHSMFLPESANDPDLVTNAVMGAVPGHPFLDLLIDGLPANAQAHRGKRLVDTVGGKYMTRMIERHQPDVTVLPWRFFAGQSIRDRDRGLEPDLTDAYAWHQWHHSDKRIRR